jgi:hypothetical protein
MVMLEKIFNQPGIDKKNILILGAPRSGTHALASVLKQQHLHLTYFGEIAMAQKGSCPWKDIEIFFDTTPCKLAHIVQSYGKLFALPAVDRIKEHTVIVEIRRRDKVKQFASWMFFKHIGAIYNFQHSGQDYIEPGSLTVTLQDIESFIIDQIIDYAFAPDYTLYYEDLRLSESYIKKNQYVYPIEQLFSNLELVNEYLGNWKYNAQ